MNTILQIGIFFMSIRGTVGFCHGYLLPQSHTFKEVLFNISKHYTVYAINPMDRSIIARGKRCIPPFVQR